MVVLNLDARHIPNKNIENTYLTTPPWAFLLAEMVGLGGLATPAQDTWGPLKSCYAEGGMTPETL